MKQTREFQQSRQCKQELTQRLWRFAKHNPGQSILGFK
jgi:hypothetical protein